MNIKDPWASVTDSIRRDTATDARFFKPVCLISAIDLTDDGRLYPPEVDANEVLLRFRHYVGFSHVDRADQGWQPLWRLSNDGIWTFFDGEAVVAPASFGPERGPSTNGQLFARFDRLTVNGALQQFWRDPDHRKALRNKMLAILADDDADCRQFARQLFDPALAHQPGKWPSEAGVAAALRLTREQVDLFGDATGVEVDDASALESGGIVKPFEPDLIDVVTKSMTVDLLLSRVGNGMIDLQPDFQRRTGIWDERRQSRLIESLLLRIPLPVLYAAENDDERWEIVDGIQRLSTIARFIRPDLLGAPPLILSGLEYLDQFEGRGFDELSERLKIRLRETELIIHLIRKGTPAEVKFNVFARINTGGVVLSPQELRHAITPGPARRVLEDWASSREFVKATDGSVRQTRMDDRELVLRFLAFHVLRPSSYRQPDMDGFLIRAMKTVNRLPAGDLATAHAAFLRSMNAAHALFGHDAFRKRFSVTAGRQPINKALFETVSVCLADLDDDRLDALVARRDRLRAAFILLCGDRPFELGISQGTGDVAKVARRFAGIANLFKDVLQHA